MPVFAYKAVTESGLVVKNRIEEGTQFENESGFKD